MNRLVPYQSDKDLLPIYENTPVKQLLDFHNRGILPENYAEHQMLIATCMDYRINLKLPENFAFLIRTGGGHIKNNDFFISFAIAVRDLFHIAIIGHNSCGMTNLSEKKEEYVEGLVKDAGWLKSEAEDYFDKYAPIFEIKDEVGFVLEEAELLRTRYPKISVAPLMYILEENKLFQIQE